MKETNVNLAVYEALRDEGYSRDSILAACNWTISQLRSAQKHFTVEETYGVDGMIDYSKLRISRKGQYNDIDMDEILEALNNGVTIQFLAEKYDIPYQTLWARIDALRTKATNN